MFKLKPVMKNLILIIPLFFVLLVPTLTNAQIKEYFLPSNEYFNRIFRYETKEIENDNGRFSQKSDVIYELDKSGNFKKITKRRMFTYGIFNHEETLYQYYNIDKTSVTLIYSKGILTDFFNLYPFRKECILKYPPAKWSDNSDPDVTTNFESKMGTLKSEYGEYQCIIVTKTYKAKSPSLKEMEDEKVTYYYAKGLGLVKTEHLVKGDENDYSLLGTLIDNFSSASYFVKEQKELEEKSKREFLQEREVKYYLLSDYKKESYEEIKTKTENQILQLIDPKGEFDFTVSLKLLKRYDGAIKTTIDFSGKISIDLKQKTDSLLTNIELQLIVEDIYHMPVNTSAEFTFDCKTIHQNCTISNLDKGYVINGNENAGRFILSDLSNSTLLK
jgi:hypothetical protein